MSRRADITVILVTERVIARADFSGHQAQSPGHFARWERSGDQSLLEAVQSAIEKDHLPGRRVVVLSTTIWNQVVSVPRLGIESVADEQLTNALKYEVEPLAGVDAEAASLAWVEQGERADQKMFWVNVLPAIEWEQIHALLASRKVREVRLTHPVAIFDPRDKQASNRVELWNQSACLVTDRRPARVALVTAGSERWISDLGFETGESLFASHASLVAPGQSAGQSVDMNLNDEAELKPWLQHAARNLLASQGNPRPWIRRQRTSSAATSAWLLRAAAITLVLLFCGWHFLWINGRNHHVQDQIVRLEQPAREKEKYDSMLRGVMEQREETINRAFATKSNLQRVAFFANSQTDRLHHLLQHLVNLRTSDLVIRQISIEEQGTVISGISLDSDAAPLLTNRLRDAAAPLGWEIHPASQHGQMKMTSGGPWTFSILLEDVGPPALLRESRRQTVDENASSDQQVSL